MNARWVSASASVAPVLLIGGWTLAAARQPSFDASVETISALAALDATDRWVMGVALVGTGAAHAVTALGLRDAAPAGRVVLAAGGIATAVVAAFPLPRADESWSSLVHAGAAALAFGSLTLWPVLAQRSDGRGLLRTPAGLVASGGLAGLLGWFGVELLAGTDRVGLAERVAAAAQVLWPLAVVAVATARGRGR